VTNNLDLSDCPQTTFVIQRYYPASGWLDFVKEYKGQNLTLDSAREWLTLRTNTSPNSAVYNVFEDGSMWRIVERVQRYYEPYNSKSYVEIFGIFYI